MKSRIASVRAAGGLDRVNCAVQLLEDEWQRHGEVQLKRFWNEPPCRAAVDSVSALAALAELVKADLRCRFDRGQSPAVAEYLEQFPELRAADSRVLSLVYEEYCLNEERGTAPDIDAFCNRYPDWKSSLISQLEYHRLFSQAAGGRPSLPRFPEAGQVFEVFRLQSLLGKGGMSRVFLARDLSLGGKQVVLKVALDRGQEPQVQGPLEHPHIVPVNSVVYPAEGELCGLSMPFRPGLPLDEVIARVDPASRPRSAMALWQALVAGTADSLKPETADESATTASTSQPAPGPRGDGWDGFPTGGSYARGVAWIIMIVARALHYAHTKQTFHRDIKPANILLTLQNGPQLLDFNLAESPHSADHAQAALHGGTLPYMAPEQIEAFINPDLWEKVGAQADIYSLGLVFRELLTGQKPELPERSVAPARALRAVLDHRPLLDSSVRRSNPAIPHAIEAIVAKCLSVAPNDRYLDARSLEEDLSLFLTHAPLRHTVNPSRRERVGNWMSRKRRTLGAVAGLTAACLAIAVGVAMRPVPVHASPEFLDAVRKFDMGQSAADAAARFKTFEKRDPNSALVKCYVGFALKASGAGANSRSDPADVYLRDALGKPELEATAITWFNDNAKLDAYLVDFAESRIVRADKLTQGYDRTKSEEEDEDRDKLLKSPGYQLAMNALSLAEKLNPGSVKTQRLLAKTEQHFNYFDRAYHRLSRCIESSHPTTQTDALFYAHESRGWVAGRWAQKDLKDQAVTADTRARLLEAETDYDYCKQYLDFHAFQNVENDQALKNHYIMQHRLRAIVILAEVEIELSLPLDAEKHLIEGESLARAVNEFDRSKKLNMAPVTRWVQKIDECWDRLEGYGKPGDLAANNPTPR